MVSDSRDTTYKSRWDSRQAKQCHKCTKTFKDGDKIHIGTLHKAYHKRCWEALFI
jgi:hypothetical protein